MTRGKRNKTRISTVILTGLVRAAVAQWSVEAAMNQSEEGKVSKEGVGLRSGDVVLVDMDSVIVDWDGSFLSRCGNTILFTSLSSLNHVLIVS